VANKEFGSNLETAVSLVGGAGSRNFPSLCEPAGRACKPSSANVTGRKCGVLLNRISEYPDGTPATCSRDRAQDFHSAEEIDRAITKP